MRGSLVAVSSFCLSLFAPLAGTAKADEGADDTTAAPEQEPGVASGNQGAAAQRFEEAEAAYVAGDLTGAFDKMKEAHELSGRPELLFNLGQLARELGQCRPALGYYADYLAALPNGHRRQDALRLSAELEPHCPPAASAKPEPAVEPASLPSAPPAPPVVHDQPEPPAKRGATLRVLGFTALGLGAASAGAGVVFALRARDAEQDLERASVWSAEDERRGLTSRTESRVAFAAAAGFAAGGALLLFLAPSAGERQAASLTISVGENQVGAEARCRF